MRTSARRPAKSYRDLVVWQKARRTVSLLYGITAKFPSEEKFNLTGQIRRSVVSIPSNVAEGFGRRTQADFLRFLFIARGSLFEVETELTLALDQGFLSEEDYQRAAASIDEVERLLEALIDKVEARA